MTDSPDSTSDDGVLRPFVEPERPDLPAYEPPPTPPAYEPPPTPTATPPPAPPAPAPPAGRATPVSDLPTRETRVTESVAAPPASQSPPAPPPEAPAAAEPSSMDLTSGAEARTDIPDPDFGPDSRSMTIGRTPFLIGLGALLAAIVALAVLWQTSGDDGPSTRAAELPLPVDSSGVVIDTSDADALAVALAEQTERADGAESRAGALETQVADLEQQLAEQPIPALPASALERIIVSTDARFVSATDASVAVVGPFGGYANIDPETNTVTASGQIGSEATRVLRTSSTVWATNFGGNEVLRVDPVSNQVLGSIDFPGPDGLAKDGDTLLVASFTEGFIGRVDPNTSTITDRVDVGGSATAVVAAEGRIYAAVFETGEVVKIDPETFEVVDRVIVGAGPVGLGMGTDDRVFVTNRTEGTVARVDFETGDIISIPVGDGPVEVARGLGSLWVAVADAGELVEIHIQEQRIVTRTPLGGAPTGLSIAAGSLWVGVMGDRSVVRVTPDREG